MSNDNSNYNADELVPPDWLNNTFFEEVLTKKKAGKTIKVKSVKITPGTTKSDHYASVMFRAKIIYDLLPEATEEMQSLIIKTAPTIEGEKKDLLGSFKIFETESKMYLETLPKIESILREHGDTTKLHADIFYYSLQPHKCIIFEDLCELGYRTISDRHCSIEEVKAALLKLAKLHAVSFKLAKDGDISISAYNDGSFSDEKILEIKFIKEGFKNFKDNLMKYDDLRHFVLHFEKIEVKIFDRILKSFNAYKNGKTDGIFVLNHGDFHMKNMMIKQKGKNLEDLMLLDYQMSVFASPAIDVLYSFAMLFSPKMRLQNRDELFYYYFTNFQDTLKLIGFEGRIPALIDFQKELMEHGHWEIFLISSFLLTNYLLPDPTADIAKFIEDENYRNKLWQRDDIIQEIRTLLPVYLHRGYFEE